MEFVTSFPELEFFPELWNIPIDDMELSIRSYNCLKRAAINTVEDIYRYGDLSRVRNLGRKSQEEIYHKIVFYEKNGYRL